ncbi:MAG TPA: fibronectin type III domain-containing protein [Burkholderiales bacterium]|jgi:hypothetical protein|nr:fibronectin type III domain-containing protein [Burkholderiales bacterium]
MWFFSTRFSSASRRLLCSSALFAFLLLGANCAFAFDVDLTWDKSEDSDATGYMVHYGEESGNYTAKVDAGNSNSYTVKGLLAGRTYFFTVTTYDPSRNESGYSNEASRTVLQGEQNNSMPSDTVSGNKMLASGAANVGSSGSGGGGCVVSDGSRDISLPLLAGLALLGAIGRARTSCLLRLNKKINRYR